MIKIGAKIYFEERCVDYKMIECPVCGQKLTEVGYVNGVATLRVKCRRCKHYIDIDLTGVNEEKHIAD